MCHWTFFCNWGYINYLLANNDVAKTKIIFDVLAVAVYDEIVMSILLYSNAMLFIYVMYLKI